MANSPRYSRESPSRIDFPKTIQPYLQRIWLIVLFTVGVGGVGWIWAMRLPARFDARATLYIAKQQQKVISIEGAGQQDRMDDQTMLNTIVQSVRSRGVLARVVLTNNLVSDTRFTAGSTNMTLDEAIDRLMSIVTTRLRPNTLLVDITTSSTNAVLSSELANSLAKQFIADRSEKAAQLSDWGSDTLVGEVRRLEEKLRASDRKLQDFRERHKMTTVEADRQLLDSSMVKLTSEIGAIRDEIQEIKADQELIVAANGKLPDLLTVPGIAKSQQIIALNQLVLQQHLLVANYTNRYKELHPKLIQARQQLADLRSSLTDAVGTVSLELEKRMPALEARETSLKEDLSKIQVKAQDLNRLSAEYSGLDREVATDTALQQAVLKRIKELELTRQVEVVPISISEEASVPKFPASPNRPRIVLQAISIGFILGMGIVYGLHSMDSSLQSVDEAEERLGLPVLGAISLDAQSQNKANPRIVMLDEAHGLTAEGFRSLRAASTMLGRSDVIKVRLLCSAQPAEGKSFCAINYAVSLAQLGQRVVLVDFDLRRPTIGNRLGMKDDVPGVTSYLLGQKRLDEALHTTRVPDLMVMPAGPRIPNPAEQLAREHTKELFEELCAKFDAVIVDTAPVNSVSDTLALLPFSQVLFLVVRAGKTSERSVKRAIQELRRAHGQVNGLILNQLPKRGGYGYYYYYYSKGGYKSGGVYGAPSKSKDTGAVKV